MPKKREWKFIEFDRIVRNSGYIWHHTTGDHEIYYKGKKHISVPHHNLNCCLAQRLIKQYNLEVKK